MWRRLIGVDEIVRRVEGEALRRVASQGLGQAADGVVLVERSARAAVVDALQLACGVVAVAPCNALAIGGVVRARSRRCASPGGVQK